MCKRSSWHRDHGASKCLPIAVPGSDYNRVKCFIMLSDVEPGGGPLGLVPGSHLWEAGGPGEEWQGVGMGELPGHVKAAVPAGTMILFDMRTWHAGMAYTDERAVDRDNITVTYAGPLPVIEDAVYGYEPNGWPTQCYGRWLDLGWMQEERGALGTPVRRQLFGVELTHPAMAGSQSD